jgi:hypothetical protein
MTSGNRAGGGPVTRLWPKRVYDIRTTFHAPLSFVFTWSTDISSIDPELRRRDFVRKIIRKTPTQTVYEDLEETTAGWGWDRNVTTRAPPDRWRLDATGNHYDTVANYRLRPVEGGRTELHLRFRLRPKSPGDRLPPKGRCERDVLAMWRLYARALERDYRRTAGRRSSGTPASERVAP